MPKSDPPNDHEKATNLCQYGRKETREKKESKRAARGRELLRQDAEKAAAAAKEQRRVARKAARERKKAIEAGTSSAAEPHVPQSPPGSATKKRVRASSTCKEQLRKPESISELMTLEGAVAMVLIGVIVLWPGLFITSCVCAFFVSKN